MGPESWTGLGQRLWERNPFSPHSQPAPKLHTRNLKSEMRNLKKLPNYLKSSCLHQIAIQTSLQQKKSMRSLGGRIWESSGLKYSLIVGYGSGVFGLRSSYKIWTQHISSPMGSLRKTKSTPARPRRAQARMAETTSSKCFASRALFVQPVPLKKFCVRR